MEKDSFQFVLKSHIFPIPSIFKHLVDISPKISKLLVFDINHQYEVESNVSEEVFQSFLNYLINNTLPTIQIDTYDEFLQLSQEFVILDDYIQEKKNQFGEHLINLSGIKDNQNPNFSVYAENISLNLDDYILNYGKELIKLPIQSLYIIFNHKKRNLTQHNLAYDLIKQNFEETKNSNIFVLLDFLDGSKMSRSNIEESFKLRESRFNHMPSIDFTYLADSFEKLKKFEEKISEIENKTNDFFLNCQNEIKSLIKKHDDEKKEILERHEIEIKTLKAEISKEIEIKINEFSQKYEIEKNKLIENHEKDKKDILSHHEKVISDLQKNHSDQIKKLNDEINLLSEKLNEIKKKNENDSEIIHENQNQIEILKKNVNENEEIKDLKEKIEKIDKLIDDQKNQMARLDSELNGIKDQVINEKTNSLEKSYEFQKQLLRGINQKSGFITAEMSLNDPGILYQLKKKEKNPFDKLFIVSQSSRDMYNLIDPNTTDDFRFTNDGSSFLEFYLEQKVSINGIKIFSSYEYFPKSFDIEIDGVKIKSINEANELNGQNASMTINFDSLLAQKIRFIQTGPNWDKGSYYLRIKKIELLSTEYSNGVFSSLVDKSQNHDPHKCSVIVSSSYFNLNKFHSLNVPLGQNICTYDKENSWFQIEFLQGFVVLIGFRLKRSDDKYQMKKYKIICSDDINKPEDSWITLIDINEQTKNEHKPLDIYEFSHPSPPSKFVRIVQTGETWSNDLNLAFYHFDLFGTYF